MERADWAPVAVGVVLFVLLSPGLLLEAPGSRRAIDFGSLRTNSPAVLVHALLFFALLVLVLHLHIYA